MAVRRRTENRRMLIRECYMCGKIINTTASSPFMRQIANVNGKKQAIVYFCSESCKNKSYKHKFDGEAWKRKKQRESERDNHERNAKYYQQNKDRIKEKRKAEYWANHEEMLEAMKYQRRKRQLNSEQEKGNR